MIELAKIMEQDGKTECLETELQMTEFTGKMGKFSVRSKTPVRFTVTNTGKKVLKIEAVCEIVLDIPCDRCLEPVAVSFPIRTVEEIDMKQTEKERAEDLNEMNYVKGTQIDPDLLVYGEILLQWPERVLCSEDCKGICSVCGMNKNKGSCNCETFVPDPRMAGIADIFKQFQEKES